MSTSSVTSTATISHMTSLASVEQETPQIKGLSSAQVAITSHGENLLTSAKKGIDSQSKKLPSDKMQPSGISGLPSIPETLTQIVNVHFSSPPPELQEYLQQVGQLSFPDLLPLKMARSREEFIERFKLKEGAANPFTQHDVECVNQMILTYPFSDKVTLMSLFGMESIDILKLLKNSKLQLSSHLTDKILRQWQTIYMRNSAILQALVNNTSLQRHRRENKLSKEDILTFDRVLKDNLKQWVSKLPEAQVLLKSFLKKWNKHQALFMKFISHDESSILLWETALKYLGANEVMQSQGHTIASRTELLVKHAINSCESVHAVDGISSVVLAQFKEIVRELSGQTYLVGTKQQILTQLRILAQKIAEKLDFFMAMHIQETSELEKAKENKQTPSIQAPLLATCIIWIGDLYNTLQDSMLPLLDSSYKMSRNYEKRLHASLTVLAHPWKQTPAQSSTVSPLSDIQREFIKQLSFLQSEAQKIVDRMDWCHQGGLVPLPFVSKQLKAFLKSLEPIAAVALQRLEKAAMAPAALANVDLLEETALIAQALLAVHDIKMLLANSSGWPYDLPLAYLEFLALQKMTNPEDVLPLHSPQEPLAVFSGCDPNTSASETKEPPLSEGKKSSFLHSASSLSKKEVQLAKPCSLTSKEALPFEGTSRRHLLRALDRLGFYSVEGGAHTLVKNQSGQTVTTVPRHNELNRNLVRLIGRQVLQSFEVKDG